jgi:hypothetical protein
MKRTVVLAAILFTLSGLQACNDDNAGITPDTGDTPSGKLTAATECKSTATKPGVGVFASGESAVEYSYNAAARKLTLKHVNAAFNCCPGTLSASVHVEDNLITIIEKESEASCNCNCLYDLDIEISNLAQKSWNIVFVEPYLSSPDLPLSFVIDLTTSAAGRHAVPRAMYPWGI